MLYASESWKLPVAKAPLPCIVPVQGTEGIQLQHVRKVNSSAWTFQSMCRWHNLLDYNKMQWIACTWYATHMLWLWSAICCWVRRVQHMLVFHKGCTSASTNRYFWCVALCKLHQLTEVCSTWPYAYTSLSCRWQDIFSTPQTLYSLPWRLADCQAMGLEPICTDLMLLGCLASKTWNVSQNHRNLARKRNQWAALKKGSATAEPTASARLQANCF